jgi:hypothetical protein
VLFIAFQSDRLTEAFGSSKKKRSVASRKKNLIDKDELDSTVVDAVQGELINLSKEEQSKFCGNLRWLIKLND